MDDIRSVGLIGEGRLGWVHHCWLGENLLIKTLAMLNVEFVSDKRRIGDKHGRRHWLVGSKGMEIVTQCNKEHLCLISQEGNGKEKGGY